MGTQQSNSKRIAHHDVAEHLGIFVPDDVLEHMNEDYIKSCKSVRQFLLGVLHDGARKEITLNMVREMDRLRKEVERLRENESKYDGTVRKLRNDLASETQLRIAAQRQLTAIKHIVNK